MTTASGFDVDSYTCAVIGRSLLDNEGPKSVKRRKGEKLMLALNSVSKSFKAEMA